MSTMTLEQVRDTLRAAQIDWTFHHGDGHTSSFRQLADAIDAHLRERDAAKASYWAAISHDGEIVVAYPTNDGNDGDAARTECNQYINDALINGMSGLRLVPLYEAGAPMLASARVPDGWQLVPIELTKEMVSIANKVGCWGCYEGSGSSIDEGNPEDIWDAMLAAAPKRGEG